MKSKKKALVTGGSSGIGREICRQLHQNSYSVINADKSPPPDQEAASWYEGDLVLPDTADKLYAHVIERLGIPDLLVLNAGKGLHEKLTEGDPAKWEHTFLTNVMGPLRVMRAFVGDMMREGDGRIIVISSTASAAPYPYGGPYGASKVALERAAFTLALEAGENLKVSVLAPGVVDTAFFSNMGAAHSVEEIGWGSLAAEEVATAVCSIASLPANSHIPWMVITPPGQPFPM